MKLGNRMPVDVGVVLVAGFSHRAGWLHAGGDDARRAIWPQR